MTRYGMVIDKQSCVGCNACTIACMSKNGNPPGVYYSKVLASEVGTYPDTWVDNVPVLCNHCKNPVCVAVCPTGATTQTDEGIVVVDPVTCIGCSTCANACPYGARVLNEAPQERFEGQGFQPFEEFYHTKHIEKTMGKCDFCQEFIAKGEDPICVRTCMGTARYFGDLDDPESEVSQLVAKGAQPLLPEEGTEPCVYYLA